MAKNKHKILECGQKRVLLGGPKDAKARKVVFAITSQIKAQAKIISRTNARESHKKERARKKLILNQSGYSHAWEYDDWSSSQWPGDSWTPAAAWYSTKAHTAWMAVPSLNLAYHPTHVVLDLGCTRSIGSR